MLLCRWESHSLASRSGAPCEIVCIHPRTHNSKYFVKWPGVTAISSSKTFTSQDRRNLRRPGRFDIVCTGGAGLKASYSLQSKSDRKQRVDENPSFTSLPSSSQDFRFPHSDAQVSTFSPNPRWFPRQLPDLVLSGSAGNEISPIQRILNLRTRSRQADSASQCGYIRNSNPPSSEPNIIAA